MKFNIEFKNFESDGKTRKLIQQLIRKLDRKLPGFSNDEVFLRLMIEANPARTLFRASLTLSVPEKTLAAKEERHDLDETIRDAFAEIDRQVEQRKAILRGEPDWKRKARREELRKIR
jgi:ribosome-associated translation inhibitor RaiA